MELLDYVYEKEENIVTTYKLKRDENGLFLETIYRFHFDILGEALINDLNNRGHLEINDACLIYGVDSFEKRKPTKNRKVKKKLRDKK